MEGGEWPQKLFHNQSSQKLKKAKTFAICKEVLKKINKESNNKKEENYFTKLHYLQVKTKQIHNCTKLPTIQ